MRLKRVRIFGFKTFADRTEFSLEGGIVAVVGPNGCGKSNLVDAILWALGESNSRHLRAASSQDVIFSGSTKRKPVGFAEVTLLFDNSDGALPVDTAEVAVTRRLSRSGESDYFINRTSCRQRDIHELLADSGLGRSGYSIVGQKEIDQALAASPEERRAWVDEAAGVQRYRTRKMESLKRIAGAKEHLTRVDDILRELESQRQPLKEEAEVAAKYRLAADSLRQVETGLLMQDLARAAAEVEDLERRLAASVELVRGNSQQAESAESDAAKFRAEALQAQDRIDRIRNHLQENASKAEKSDSEIRMCGERLRSLDEVETSLQAGNAEAILDEIRVELENCSKEEASDREALDRVRDEAGGADSEIADLREHVRLAEEQLSEARRRQAARLRRIAEREHRREARELALRELQGIEADLPSLTAAREVASLEAAAALEAFSNAEQHLKESEARQSELREVEDRLGSKIRGLLAEKASLEGRKRGIQSTIQANEGLAQGSRAVLDAARKGHLSDSYVPVGQAVRTSREHAIAIETALGSAANDLIVEDERAAKAAIGYLKENRLGRATFQPLPLMRTQRDSSDLVRLLVRPEVVGKASDLIQCEESHKPVIESLLGRILIVRNLDDSLRLAKTTGWSRIVTLDGEVVHSSGAVSGGHASKHTYGLVQRQSDLSDLEKQLRELDRSVTTALAQAEEAAEARRGLIADLAQLELEHAARRQTLNEAKDYLHSLNAELTAAERSMEKLRKETGALEDQPEFDEAIDIEGIQAERDQAVHALATSLAGAGQAKERLEEAERRWKLAQARLSAAQRRLHSAKSGEAERVARLARLGPEREKLFSEINAHEVAKVSSEQERARLEHELSEAIAARVEKSEQETKFAELARQIRTDLIAIADANHQAELSRARAESRRATAAERLLEEYGISEEDAMEAAPGIAVPSDAYSISHRLRREIRAMGNVNLGAIEAFERLSARHEELSAQRSDVLEGVEQIEAGMRELDKLTRDQFLETFGLVESAYADMFQKLFGGGEGKIYLDRPDSILESGIEIEVTLPGKKRQRLDLLSGGERALCAAGFLFALLQVKPSPLVVLDEIDAPLDGRNVERFGDVLQGFTDRTQFIVITHNPTTIERAPVWLGVTMQEPGVSTLIPARLPQQTEGGSEASTARSTNYALA